MIAACACGAIELELTGEPLVCLYCHCSDCQAVHGGAYVPAALYRFEQTRLVTGRPLLWVRKHTARATCRDCGTRVWAEPPGEWLRSVPGGLLPAGVFVPAFHMQCQDAVAPVADGLPHYRGFPALLGGSDELMPW